MRNSAFEKYVLEYDNWYKKHKGVYLSELKALESALSKGGKGLEIGVGTGRFGVPLGVRFGVDLSPSMAEFSRKRGIETVIARGEALPFKDNLFDLALIVATLCFFKEPYKAIVEAKRVLKRGGKIVVGFIDRESFLGRLYLEKKKDSLFYRGAEFFSVPEASLLLKQAGFKNLSFFQTLFSLPDDINGVQRVKEGAGEGGFVVISGIA